MENHQHQHEDSCCTHGTVIKQHTADKPLRFFEKYLHYLPACISLVLLLIGIASDYYKPTFYTSGFRLIWYLLAYIPVAWPVIKQAFLTVAKGDIFTEFLLMALATVGALALGEFPEAVAVMLFYSVGELFQDAAVSSAKNNIKALLDVRPNVASVLRNGTFTEVNSLTVAIGETVQVKVGEKVPLDGVLVTDNASFNTAALTGESKPQHIEKSQQVLAGMINLENVVTITTTKRFEDSALSRILDLVQNATAKKAKTELLIRKFAKIYTPIVFFLAVAVVLLPMLFVQPYSFNVWLYRALVFLVISCPCALVISIPLGYFGGIGAASANGILFKGANYLDILAKVNTVVLDKTGTLTEGVFAVQEVNSLLPEETFFNYLVSIESQSTHPIAKAIVAFNKNTTVWPATNVQEVAGHGLKAVVNNVNVLAGNAKLLTQFNISYPTVVDEKIDTLVVLAVDGKYAGYVTIADKVKDDAETAINGLQKLGVHNIVMLSGDKNSITQKIAKSLGITQAFGNLLPEGKVEKLTQLKNNRENVIAFVGDGINDAPVLALSNVGIAMGGMGSDVAIETADVVIQNDAPSKIATAIRIGKATRKIVFQNIGLAFGVKAVVLVLGAGGLATMWEAVFADVGVAFLAILNAVRIQKMKF